MQTREQKYAASIYRSVDAVKNESFAEDYSSAAKNLPVLIRTAGLVQALHFVAARNKGSERLISDLAQSIGRADRDALLDDTRAFALDEYIRLTEQCLSALKWFKRFAGVHIDK